MRYTIQSNRLKVKIAKKGAELVSVKKDGKEKLWQNPTREWKRHAPLLFPVCGRFGVTVDGKKYPMKSHGFARNSTFRLVEKAKNRIRFLLSANKKTKKMYPFDFHFYVEYEVKENALLVRYEVENPTDKVLGFSTGGHESFALDGDVDGYKLVFDEVERLVHLPHDEDGFLIGSEVDFGESKELYLPVRYLSNSDTMIFSSLRSRALELCRRDGEKLARITFDGFSNLLLWRPSRRAHMICIEPWLTLPSVFGEMEKEFLEKKGIRKVAPHSKETIERTITYY